MNKITAFVCAMAISIFTFSMPASAERGTDRMDRGTNMTNDITNDNYNDRTPATRNVTTANDNNDNDSNWEWIGLLGLAGLLGLRRRDREESTR
ncbi:WGxxGxxG family protein [Fictibacillus sp. CENA-BCM004]|uniref:WGxxGxxG family protein n=2 Tax=Fictibacillus terranigra TaxID=3058424 RepID=A0ABT8E8E7_9BACL|nr:WGxxGxxG family protein [Fictibacillus sp. CENA-BCM004]MDN4074159.1 WGxxGxxG family protein [Fictibacillus sp. CENA-BCM004]